MTPLRNTKYSKQKKVKVESGSSRYDYPPKYCIVFGDPLLRLDEIKKELSNSTNKNRSGLDEFRSHEESVKAFKRKAG